MHIQIQGLTRLYPLSADDESLQRLLASADAHGRIPKSALARLYFPAGCTADSARRSWGRMVNTAHEPDGLRLTSVLDDICATWRHDHALPEAAAIAILHFCGPAPDAAAEPAEATTNPAAATAAEPAAAGTGNSVKP